MPTCQGVLVLDVLVDNSGLSTGVSTNYPLLLAKKDVLKGAKFGMPAKQVWESAKANEEQTAEYEALVGLLNSIKTVGAMLYEVDFPSAEEILPPSGWDWDFAEGKMGSKLSEFQVVKTEFYQDLKII
ncbi:uncharacterized protein A1O9_00714 [Exophiala aquamarina CBS 119918]|uniref:Uncharacterized protein n=1 Tax=Exophiala aquamarina CBS 119918 TaxID=1182545 RepID=A0A072PSB5_9EURO|nr:uncharacterized protein A1O9_00714 [Exophiala aquamarina CBS 119918]KEF62741.1 hypothetical protein A1O9_00714 [Exophiala aquamarina CBS 119918]